MTHGRAIDGAKSATLVHPYFCVHFCGLHLALSCRIVGQGRQVFCPYHAFTGDKRVAQVTEISWNFNCVYIFAGPLRSLLHCCVTYPPRGKHKSVGMNHFKWGKMMRYFVSLLCLTVRSPGGLMPSRGLDGYYAVDACAIVASAVLSSLVLNRMRTKRGKQRLGSAQITAGADHLFDRLVSARFCSSGVR